MTQTIKNITYSSIKSVCKKGRKVYSRNKVFIFISAFLLDPIFLSEGILREQMNETLRFVSGQSESLGYFP